MQGKCESLIMTLLMEYHRSSVVEKVLLEAHAVGRKFSVIVVDSRPMLEGAFFVARTPCRNI